jgi:hypothetical protein
MHITTGTIAYEQTLPHHSVSSVEHPQYHQAATIPTQDTNPPPLLPTHHHSLATVAPTTIHNLLSHHQTPPHLPPASSPPKITTGTIAANYHQV